MERLVVLCFCLGLAVARDYDDLQVVRVVPWSEGEADTLRGLITSGHLDLWAAHPGGAVDVMLHRQLLHQLSHLDTRVLIPDVNELVEAQKSSLGARARAVDWLNYNNLTEIHAFLDEIAASYPTVASPLTLGSSWEGRPLKGLVLTSGGVDDGTRPVFFIDAGFHAREWVAPAVATYFIQMLVEDTTGLLDQTVWVVVPSMNPDGYEYSWTDDRMWRKTRSDRGDLCMGVDPNRNFDFHWMEIGASDLPCSETYAGPTPCSEPECQALTAWMTTNSARVQAYITMHSYSQLFMYPYGYTTQPAENAAELDRVAGLAVAALEAVYGTNYEYGAVSSILYFNSGSSRDYVKGVVQAPYVYTIELRDTGTYGFILPPEQILPTAQETWEAVKVVYQEAFAPTK